MTDRIRCDLCGSESCRRFNRCMPREQGKRPPDVFIDKETNPRDPWSYWLWHSELVTVCLHPGIKGHDRKRQGACRECWARLVEKIQGDMV